MRERDQIVAAAQQLQAQLAAAQAAAGEGHAAAAAGEELRAEVAKLQRDCEQHEEVGVGGGGCGALRGASAWQRAGRGRGMSSARDRPGGTPRAPAAPRAPKARRAMRREVEDERAARGAAEEARARAEAERNRLQVARDDLAAALRVAEQRAEEAAEEQVGSRAAR
jgi:hypothetical protein